MNLWQRWKKVSINNKLMIYMTAMLAVATTLYTLMYRSQVEFTEENAKQSAEQTDRLIAASERLAEASKSTLDEAKRVNKEAADRADRTLKAIETQADASKSQARTSQVSARAAEQSAFTAKETFRLIERPSLGVDSGEVTKLEAGQEIEGTVRFKNSGRTPAFRATVQSRFALEPAKEVSAPCPEVSASGLIGLISRSPIPINGTKEAHLRSFISATDEDVERIGSGKWWLYVYVIAKYEGVYGQKYFTEYYARYNPKGKLLEECGAHNDAN